MGEACAHRRRRRGRGLRTGKSPHRLSHPWPWRLACNWPAGHGVFAQLPLLEVMVHLQLQQLLLKSLVQLVHLVAVHLLLSVQLRARVR